MFYLSSTLIVMPPLRHSSARTESLRIAERSSVMRTLPLRSVALAAVTVVTLTASAFAQTSPSPTLNSLDVQRLIKSTEPGDQARLGAHFAALADQYVSEAKEHN